MWRSGDGDGRTGRSRSPLVLAGAALLDGPLLGTRLAGTGRRERRSRSGVPLSARVWSLAGSRERARVTCIACGRSVPEAEAREYDKRGDRWDRRDKTFEHLCKGCHGDLTHQPRRELESLLVDARAGERDRADFLASYCDLVEERYGPLADE